MFAFSVFYTDKEVYIFGQISLFLTGEKKKKKVLLK